MQQISDNIQMQAAMQPCIQPSSIQNPPNNNLHPKLSTNISSKLSSMQHTPPSLYSKYIPYHNYSKINQLCNATFHSNPPQTTRQSKAYSAFYSKTQPKSTSISSHIPTNKIQPKHITLQNHPTPQIQNHCIIKKLQSANQAIKSILKDKQNQILHLKSINIKLKAQNQHYRSKILNSQTTLHPKQQLYSQATQQLPTLQLHNQFIKQLQNQPSTNKQIQFLKQQNNQLKQLLQTKQPSQTIIFNEQIYQQILKSIHSQNQQSNNHHHFQIKQLIKNINSLSIQSKLDKFQIVRNFNEKIEQTIKKNKNIQSQSNDTVIQLENQGKDNEIKCLPKIKQPTSENIKYIQLINQMRQQSNKQKEQIVNLIKNLQIMKKTQQQCTAQIKQEQLKKTHLESIYQKVKKQNQKMKQDKEKYSAKIKMISSQKQQLVNKNIEDISRIKLQFEVKAQKNKFQSQMILEKTKIDFEEIVKKKDQEFQRYRLTVEANNNKHKSQIEHYKESYKSIQSQKKSMELHKDAIIARLKLQIQMLKQLCERSQFISISNQKAQYRNLKELYDKKQKQIQQLNHQIKVLEQKIFNLEKDKHEYQIAIQQVQQEKLEIRKYYQGKLESQITKQLNSNQITNENSLDKINQYLSPDSIQRIQSTKNNFNTKLMRDKQKKKQKRINQKINDSQESIKIEKQPNKQLGAVIFYLNSSETIKDLSKSSNQQLDEKDQIIKQLNYSLQEYRQIIKFLKSKIQKYQSQFQNIRKVQSNDTYELVYQCFQQVLEIFNIEWKQNCQPPHQQLMLSINMFTKRIQDLMNALNLLQGQLQKVTGQNISMKGQHEEILKKCQYMISNAQQQNDELIQRCNQAYKKLESAEEYISILQKIIQQCNLECIAANISKIQLKMIIKNLNYVKSSQSTQCDFYKNDHNQIQKLNDHSNQISKILIEREKESQIDQIIQSNQKINQVKSHDQVKKQNLNLTDVSLSIASKKLKFLNENTTFDTFNFEQTLTNQFQQALQSEK